MSVGSPTARTWSSSQWRPDNEFETDRIARVEPAVMVIVGVDTHKHVHVAVAVDRLGARLGSAACRRIGAATPSWWPGRARSALSRPLGSRAPGRTVSGWRASFAATPFGSSKSIIATGESDGTTGRVTRSTRRWPRGRYSPGSRPPSRRVPTARPRWSARSRSLAIPLSKHAVLRSSTAHPARHHPDECRRTRSTDRRKDTRSVVTGVRPRPAAARNHAHRRPYMSRLPRRRVRRPRGVLRATGDPR